MAWRHTDCICSLHSFKLFFCWKNAFDLIWGERNLDNFLKKSEKGIVKLISSSQKQCRQAGRQHNAYGKQCCWDFPPILYLLYLSKSSRFPLLGICIVCRFYLRSESHDIIVGFHSPFSLYNQSSAVVMYGMWEEKGSSPSRFLVWITFRAPAPPHIKKVLLPDYISHNCVLCSEL